MQTAEEQLALLKAETRFRDLIEREALMTDVMQRAIRHVVRDAADVFELQTISSSQSMATRIPAIP